MVEFALPKNSTIGKGRHWPAPQGAKTVKTFKVYRYDPESGQNPRWDTYDVDVGACGPMVLDAIIHIKNTMDPTLVFPALVPRGGVRLLRHEHRRAQHPWPAPTPGPTRRAPRSRSPPCRTCRWCATWCRT